MQEIDLYPEQLRPKRDALSPRTVLIGLCLYAVVLFAYAGNTYFDLYEAQKSLKSVQDDNDVIRNLSAETELIAKTKTLDESLLVKEQLLKQEIEVKMQQLTLVNVIGVVKNISAYATLKDLQDYHQKNMWIEEVRLVNSGKDIYLRGYTRDETVLPRYLGELQNGESFKSKKFKLISMSKDEDSKNLMFVLSSQPTGGVASID